MSGADAWCGTDGTCKIAKTATFYINLSAIVETG
jgi:hypothetical protein